MVSELRYIAFTHEDALKGAVDYLLRRQTRLPSGAVVSVRFEAEPAVVAHIGIARDDPNGLEHVTLKTEELAAALVLFCIKHDIPLPRDSRKTIKVVPDGIALVIGMGLKDEELEPFYEVDTPLFADRPSQEYKPLFADTGAVQAMPLRASRRLTGPRAPTQDQAVFNQRLRRALDDR